MNQPHNVFICKAYATKEKDRKPNKCNVMYTVVTLRQMGTWGITCYRYTNSIIHSFEKKSYPRTQYFNGQFEKDLLTFCNEWQNEMCTLLCEVTINSICKCFVVFLYPHLRIKSKTSAYIRHLL